MKYLNTTDALKGGLDGITSPNSLNRAHLTEFSQKNSSPTCV